MREIYRGIWADRLENGQNLPIGGHLLSDKLTRMLKLDFESFNGQLENYRSPRVISKMFAQEEQKVTEWLAQVGSTADPYLFFVANTTQIKVQSLLDVRPESSEKILERLEKFKDDKAKLTDLKGVAMCAEKAAFGQYLLQGALENRYTSAYVSGVEAQSPSGELRDHCFIVIGAPTSQTYIFDISRPRSGNNLPRILETDVPFTYELFSGTKNLLVGATEVLQGGRLYFGVGHPLLADQEPVIATAN